MCTSSIFRSMHQARKCRLVEMAPGRCHNESTADSRVPQRSPPTRPSRVGSRSCCPTSNPKHSRVCTHPSHSVRGSLARSPHGIVHEVQRPLLIRRRTDPQRLPGSHAVFALLSPDTQPGLSIHAMHSFVVQQEYAFSQRRACELLTVAVSSYRYQSKRSDEGLRRRLVELAREVHFFSVASEQHMQAPIAPTRLVPHSRLQDCELHPFFRITDCNASLSKLRSAASLFNRAFSCSS